ncbi:gliding motility-associated C-terminal domain-containing protein [Flavobacterium azooxidireducens]|uniref:Gliding motility-associated C-terminal domain-containing protein n=1 Tax=Flavobacterium azooxidireducens TaxID=1871076 RepID=A0ABY4KFI6_9FLAO|nr:gliding motility-associated C-terminal domain-containing protein [Flavobacterium azooxidireducens]UPQ78538.1 gliding motility-associated C-terminal domain-containing protein [Flavobacterium azooxidireducens]
MKRKYNYFLLLWAHFFVFSAMAQDVTFYQQFSGRYDFTLIGNTLNTEENNPTQIFDFLTQSSAELNLSPQQTVLKAYLYWAGSGTGDFDITLNGTEISAERTFSHSRLIFGLPFDFFAASTDITEFIQQNGNGTYTFADIEISEALFQHFPFRTNFSGWAIVIIYEDNSLPINQINLYDGLEGLPTQIDFVLDNLLITNNLNSKIGFLAWEGDTAHQNNENIRINGNIVEELPLNPMNRIFNSTNTITGSSDLYNMDIDVFTLDEFVNIGDTSANLRITSGGDFVLINTVLTKFTTESIDATIEIDWVQVECDNRKIEIDYAVYNLLSNNPLPINTPIAIYANGILVGTTFTTIEITQNQSESNSIIIQIPDTIPSPFELTFSVDDVGDGTGIIIETNEENNDFTVDVNLSISTSLPPIEPFKSCNIGFGRGSFNLEELANQLAEIYEDEISFHENLSDAQLAINSISILSNYQSETPKKLYIRLETNPCSSITSVDLEVRNCPPIVYNFISANEDGFNDYFFIDGLRNIFLNFQIEIYNRWGHLIWKGNQNTEDWRGEVSEEVKWNGDISADGTYFYLLFLNDPDYPKPLQGFLYITY